MSGLGARQVIYRAAAAAALALSLAAAPAQAITSAQEIQSPGALTNVVIGSDLSCQVKHVGDLTNEFFPPNVGLGDCGTFVSVGGALYGPDFANHPESSFPINENIYTPFTAVAQAPVTGAGTTESPFALVTTVSAGDTGLTITETDSYVTGDEAYRTDIVIANSGPDPVVGLLYRGADCYLQGSDIGFGSVSAAGAPACTAEPNNSPSGQVEEFAPLTPGFRYFEAEFTQVWEAINAQTGLPNTCHCTTEEDDGAAISWDLTVPPGAPVTYSVINNFSPAGQVIGAPETVTGPPKAVSGSQAVLTGTVNPGGKDVTDCHFDYGATTDYGKSVPCAEPVGPVTTPVAVSATVPDLKQGEKYHYILSATTAGGTTTGADQTVSTGAGPDAPTIGKTANLVPVTGTVFVKLPKGKHANAVSAVRSFFGITKGAGFVPVTEARQIPLGSQLDARRGTVEIVAASDQPAVTQSARVSGAVFNVGQVKSGLRKGLTTFTLKAGAFPGAPSYKGCPTRFRSGKSSGAHASKKAPKSVLQTLKAKDKGGKFQTRGKYSAGTVRGTEWTTIDRCDGTLTKVKRGVVDVRDFARRKTVKVRAGKKYFAKASSKHKG